MIDPLVLRARDGSEAALRELYESHRGAIMRLAYAVLGDRDEAEDVMQDVMVYALTHLDRYDPARGAFGTWLHAMAVSRCRDRIRRAKVRLRHLAAAWGSVEPHAVDPDEGLSRLDAARRIGPALAKLTPRQREAIALRDVEGMTLPEMAVALDVPLRTAQARLHSAHTALRRILAEEPEPPYAPSGAGDLPTDALLPEPDGG